MRQEDDHEMVST